MFDDNKKASPPVNLPVSDDTQAVPPAQVSSSPNPKAIPTVKQEASLPPQPTQAVKPIPAPPAKSPATQDSGVEDMFADTDLVPPHNQPPVQPQMNTTTPVNGKQGFRLGKLLLVLVIAIIVIFLLASLGSALLNRKKSSSTKKEVIKTEQPAPKQTPIKELAEPVKDTDRDQLTDDEERKLGTNINLADTDKDGLSDYDEVKRYLTNPLKADTDEDGFNDGDEVKAGYSPTGPGKLFEVPNN